MAYEIIVSVFDNPVNADAAISELLLSGVGESDINRHSATEALDEVADAEGGSGALFGGEISAEEAEVFDRSIANGGVIVSVTGLVEKSDDVIDILMKHAPADLDAQLETYDSGSPTGPVRRYASAR